ncbi:5278_t:CDS:2 [Paraglomus occultum]|uniref:cyclin-dependent kinase n=1 Tax=Paraglomus occultum TaxID=144539 RepID=A0A9N9CVR0_9GLOM|nr:5278_t:CDS:2 [Paraglomus occultum]
MEETPSGNVEQAQLPIAGSPLPVKTKSKRSKWESESENEDAGVQRKAGKKKRGSKKTKVENEEEASTLSDADEANQKKKQTVDETQTLEVSQSPALNTSTPPAFENATETMEESPVPQRDQADQSASEKAVMPRKPKPPILTGCRSVDNYEKLNRIEEGAYGVVYRARDRATGEIVALKKLKLDKEKNGFPITSLREVKTLLQAKHPNIVNVREIVVGETLTQIFIVMDFVEHDLKSLMEDMQSPFLQSEVKTIMIQLLSAVATLHDNWIIHRDLKTSNLLLNNRGQIKVADFGLARSYGSPLGPMTDVVVTLWYRAPELLLGSKTYSTAIDMWSVGCIFGELVNKEPVLPGRTEIDQLDKIFRLLGMPNEKIWPGFSKLPNAKNITHSTLRSRFPYLTENGIDLMSKLLTYDPAKRITAEKALKHPYFMESPLPKDSELFPSFPSKGAGERSNNAYLI